MDISRDRVDPSQLGDDLLVHYSIPVLDDTDEPISELASTIGSQKFRVDSDAVLVSLLNPRIPRVWRARGGPATVCSTEFAVLRPKRVAHLTLEFLHLLCRSTLFWEQLQLRAVGTTGSRQRAKAEGLLSIQVDLPSVPEQRRIVDLIGALDEQIEALVSEALALLAYLARLRDGLTTPRSPWPLVKLGEVLAIARGGSPRPIDDYFTLEASGINWIKIGDVRPGGKYIDRTAQRIRLEGASRSRRVAPGDFLLSNSMSFGRPYILRIDGCIHDGWLVLSDLHKTFDQDFLYNVLRSGGVQAQFAALASGSAVKNLNIKLVGTVAVAAPPLREQVEISSILNSTDEAHNSLVTEADRMRVVRATVLNTLLSGEVAIPESYDSMLEAM